MKKHFMVEFELPVQLDSKFISLIPNQKTVVNRYFAQGKLKSYSLSQDNSILWAIFAADTEFEVMELIAEFPLADYMTPFVSELMFHNNESQVLQFSLN